MMWQALTDWLSKKGKPKPAPTTPKINVEQVNIHWHLSDVSRMPGALTWNAQPVASFEPASQIEVKREQSTVPIAYDESLLDRARTQWQFGDWESLAKLDRETLQHHPERAKLALLAAAGRLQTDKNEEARQYIRLAQDWGISKKLVSQILIAGVHNSMGRAAAIGNQQRRALQHFENAITIGTPGSDAKLLTQARISEQFLQLGLAGADTVLKTGTGEMALAPKLPPLAKKIETLTETLQQQKAGLDEQLKKQADELVRLRKDLRANLKTEVANAARQIGDFISLQNYFSTGRLSDIQLEMNGWPVSSDYMLYLVKLIDLNDYDLIIEFGSGASTLAIAKTLAKIAPRRKGKPHVGFASFDHLEQYYQQTQAQLEHAGLADFVRLHLAPLTDYTASNGNRYPYYSCQTTLAALGQEYANRPLRLLVSVDGPPASTGKHARYPAVPLVLSHFNGAIIDFFLDDAARVEEKEISELWQKEISAAGLRANERFIQLEKGACLIHAENIQKN